VGRAAPWRGRAAGGNGCSALLAFSRAGSEGGGSVDKNPASHLLLGRVCINFSRRELESMELLNS